MDDMTAFDRQIADEFIRDAGPSEPVDDAAIFTAINATRSPQWRVQPMFSATKFVVAGAIVALFGGFLLAGVLTTQRSEESGPAVGASASPEPTASYVVTGVPIDRSLGALHSVATADGLWVPRRENTDSDDWFFGDVVHIDQGSGVQTTVQGLPEEGFDQLIPVDDAVWAIGSQAVHRIDGDSLAVTDSVTLGSVPDEYGWPVVAHGSLWLTSSRSRPSALVEIDLATRSVRGEYEADDVWWRLGDHAPGLVAVDDAIWVHSFAGREGQRLTRFDLERRAFTDTVDVAGEGSWDCCVAVDEAIWLVEQTGTLRRFDLETLEVTDTLKLKNGSESQVIGGLVADGAIWIGADDVNRIDPEAREVTDVIEVGPREKPAFLHGGIWVANHLGGDVSRIDPETRQVTHTLEAAKYLHTPIASRDVIWVYTQEGRLFRIDRAETPPDVGLGAG